MQAIVDFILELDRLKAVTHKIRLRGLDRGPEGEGARGGGAHLRSAPRPQRDRFLALWSELDDAATAEARFAHAVDRAMPVLLNLVGPPIQAGCPALWAYLEARLDEAERAGWFGAHGG